MSATEHTTAQAASLNPATATATVLDLFRKYEITDPSQASHLIRERFTQDDLEAYKAARDYLDGAGAIS